MELDRGLKKSFNWAKQAIASSKILVHYDPKLPIKVAADASAYGIGAVLSHILEDNTEHPVAFTSRTLSPSEKNYSQIDKEAFALRFCSKEISSIPLWQTFHTSDRPQATSCYFRTKERYSTLGSCYVGSRGGFSNYQLTHMILSSKEPQTTAMLMGYPDCLFNKIL